MSKERLTGEVISKEEAQQEGDLVVFSKPYTFEGETYEGIDLEGLNNIRARDMINAEKAYGRSGGSSFMPELTMEYAINIAASATGKPIEFFLFLPPKDAIKVKNKVTSFFYGQD